MDETRWGEGTMKESKDSGVTPRVSSTPISPLSLGPHRTTLTGYSWEVGHFYVIRSEQFSEK